MNNNWNTLWESVQAALGGQIPHLLGALAMLVGGWLVAVLVRAGARRGLALLGVNRGFARLTGQAVDIERGLGVTLFWVALLFWAGRGVKFARPGPGVRAAGGLVDAPV